MNNEQDDSTEERVDLHTEDTTITRNTEDEAFQQIHSSQEMSDENGDMKPQEQQVYDAMEPIRNSEKSEYSEKSDYLTQIEEDERQNVTNSEHKVSTQQNHSCATTPQHPRTQQNHSCATTRVLSLQLLLNYMELNQLDEFTHPKEVLNFGIWLVATQGWKQKEFMNLVPDHRTNPSLYFGGARPAKLFASRMLEMINNLLLPHQQANANQVEDDVRNESFDSLDEDEQETNSLSPETKLQNSIQGIQDAAKRSNQGIDPVIFGHKSYGSRLNAEALPSIDTVSIYDAPGEAAIRSGVAGFGESGFYDFR
jgi:hypothetical protein